MKPASFSVCRAGRSRRGMLLLIVMWVCFGLVVLTIYFGNSMLLEYRAADNAVAEREAAGAIEGAARYLVYALTNNEYPGYTLDPSTVKFEAVQVGQARYWVIGRGDTVSTAQPNSSFRISSLSSRLAAATSGSNPTFNLIDESSKLNLNTATVEQLEYLPGMTSELAAAIIDWRDSDSDQSDGGAEDETYMLLPDPYMTKNAKFESIFELRLLNGATWDMLRGEDANFNGVLDPNENDGDESYPPDNADGKLDPGLLEYLTVTSKLPSSGDDSGTDSSGTSGSGSSSLSQQSIVTALTDTLGQDRAQEIASTASSRLSEIHSWLQLGALGGMTSTELDTVLEAQVDLGFTVPDDSGGPININTASSAVMAAVMGGDTATADKIVSTRQGREVANQYQMGWVLDIMGTDIAAEYGAAFTNRAYQFSADIAAVGHGGHGFRRDLFIIDASDATQPRIRYRRDMTRYGWPLGNAVQLADENGSTNTGGTTTAGRGQTGS